MVPSVNSYSKPWGAWSTRRLIDFPLVKRAAAHPISVTGYSRLAICSRSPGNLFRPTTEASAPLHGDRL
jgi:hypothetical protein